MILEVCVDSIESALAAVNGGASRLELCSALSEGGLTPSVGILKALKSNLNINIPIFCMLRPRGGNDFMYSDEEIQAIIYDMEILQQNGSDGFVFGALKNQEINIEHCKLIIENAKNDPVTFHRAFDLTRKDKMHENCKLIESLGFKRILTSGFEKTAEIGIKNIKELCNERHGNIIIMPGAGIKPENLQNILEQSNCKEFHASAKVKKVLNLISMSDVAMGTGESTEETSLFVTDANIVRNLVKIAKIFEVKV